MPFNSITMAADNYNLENEGRSWFDASTAAVGATVVGAVNGVINSVGHILNAVGVNEDYNPVDTYDRLSALGMNDTTEFYGEHRQAVDTAALLAGSLVPGMVGLKAFQAAGRSAKIRDALRLPNAARLEELRKEANNAAEIGKTLWNPIHGKAAQAALYGLGLNTMETLAFETAALATTIASPVYSEMDAWDMAKNTIAMGAVGGAIGGTFSAAFTYFGVKAAVRDAALKGESIHAGIVDRAPDYVNVLRMKATDAPETAINPVLRKLAGEDAGLMLPVQNLVKQQSLQDTVTVFDKTSGIKRISELAKEDASAAMKATETQSVAEFAPRQFLELETKRIYSSADQQAIKQMANLGDHMPANSSIDSSFVRRGFLAVRDATGKVVDELKVPLGKTAADMTVQEAQIARIASAELPISPVGISSDNIIEMEKWLQQSAYGTPVDGIAYTSHEPVQALLRVKKQEVFGQLLNKGVPPEAAVKIVNIPASHKFDDALWDVPLAGMKDAASQPRFAAITYDQAALDADRTANVYAAQALRQAEEIAANERMNAYQASNSAFGFMGLPEVAASLDAPDNVAKALNTASKASDTAGFISFANGAYGTITSWAQNMGKVVSRSVQKLSAETNEELAKALTGIKADVKLADNLALTVNHLRGTSEHYVIMDVNGGKQMVRMDVAEEIMSEGRVAKKLGLDEAKNPEIIDGIKPEVLDFLHTHSRINLEKYRKPQSVIATANGTFDVKLHETYPELMPVYVPTVNLQKYNHFLLVRQDPKVFGASSHTSVIVAKDAADLDARRRRVEASIREQEGEGGLLRWQFISKAESKDYHEALGDYNYNRGLNNSRVDNTLRRAGVLAEAQPTLPSQNIAALDDIIDDFRSWHGRMAGGTVRSLMENAYGEMFMQLRMMGDDLLEYETSKAARLGQGATKKIANPYNDIIKTSLDISKFDEYRPWAMLNELTEQVGTKAIGAISNSVDKFSEAFGKGKVKRVEDLDAYTDEINKTAETMGYQLGYKQAAEHVFKDEIAKSPMLSRSISRAQGILSGYVLGIDVIQHFNNAVGLFVLQNAEFSSVLNAISKKDPSIVGNLAQVKMPGAGGKTFMATAKLNASAIKRFFQGGEVWDEELGGWVTKSGSELAAEYEQRGLSMTQLQQFRSVVDNLTFTGAEGSSEIGGKILKGAETFAEMGRKWTGGNFTEKFTRFVAADAMRQITDHGLAQGVLKSQAEAEVFWNTAVNRIQGNMLASQRPTVMQGPVGQAIGLFMTYQVNLMQQLFRYVGTGDKVATGMLMGTQTALYGMQGLPGWNFLNTHIIGNASGNTSHADMYVAANRALPKEVADWVLYGAGSNALSVINPALKFNLYSRGDLNPRQLTIFPTEVDNTVLYKATTGFIGNLLDSASNLANGAPVAQTFYQALQHNGVNRMLAGVGSVMAGGQYTSDGKLITPVNEQLGLLNVATWVRIAGAKPLNDALAADALFRNRAYDAKDAENIKKLSEAVRLDAADGSVDPEQLTTFAEHYVKSGGNLKNFNNFVIRKLKDQQQSVVEQAVGQLKGERLQNYMAIIGADEPNFEFQRRSFDSNMEGGD